MATKDKTGFGAQVILAVIILFIGWMILKWVIGVVFSVATTLVVIGAILFAAWLFIGRRDAG